MPDARISELPLATTLGDSDIAPLVQASGATTETRRATLAQLRGAVLADRGAHVRDYGAKGDGSTDDAPAIQAAIDDLKTKGGGTLFFGPRVYRIGSAVVLNGATVRLQGAGFTEGPGPGQGTWLRITTTGFTPFTFTGANSRGAGVSRHRGAADPCRGADQRLGADRLRLRLPGRGLLRRHRLRQRLPGQRQQGDLLPQLRPAGHPPAARPGLRHRRRDRRVPRRPADPQPALLDLLDLGRARHRLAAGQWRRHDLPPLRRRLHRPGLRTRLPQHVPLRQLGHRGDDQILHRPGLCRFRANTGSGSRPAAPTGRSPASPRRTRSSPPPAPPLPGSAAHPGRWLEYPDAGRQSADRRGRGQPGPGERHRQPARHLRAALHALQHPQQRRRGDPPRRQRRRHAECASTSARRPCWSRAAAACW